MYSTEITVTNFVCLEPAKRVDLKHSHRIHTKR